jgi:hypothetical protein
MALKAGSTAAVGKVFNAIAGNHGGGHNNHSRHGASTKNESRSKARYDEDDDKYGDGNFDQLDPKEKLLLGMNI